MPTDNDLLTDEEAAAILRIQPRTLRAWRNSLGLPFIRITPETIRYRRRDIDEWADRYYTAIVE